MQGFWRGGRFRFLFAYFCLGSGLATVGVSGRNGMFSSRMKMKKLE